MSATRLITDEPADGPVNMARDEALLISAGRTGVRTLRFYGWRNPTLSLGYFQATADREQHAPSRLCPLIRRATGGGAIIHDHEVTYSFAAPADDRLADRVAELYDAFHQTLIDALSDWNVHAALVGDASTGADNRAFLCFQRRSPNDVVLDGAKITGSAQRRHHGAVLQHGSVLLSTSPCAPELPGILQVSGVSIEPGELIDSWRERIAGRIHLRITASSWNEGELVDAKRLLGERYGSDTWTYRR